MTRQFLIVVDMQNDFIDGALGTAEAQAMLPAAVERINTLRNSGYTIIATLDTHKENYLQTSEGINLPVTHCVRGTKGWELNPLVLEAVKGCTLLEKPTFGSIRLPALIQGMVEEDDKLVFELMGLCTDICVVSNALLLKAFFPEAEICVHADCCAGVTPEKHNAALETMRSCQIHVI